MTGMVGKTDTIPVAETSKAIYRQLGLANSQLILSLVANGGILNLRTFLDIVWKLKS